MKDIELVSNLVIKNLKNNNIPLTPENYEKEFFKVSTQKQIDSQEKFELEIAIENLCKQEKLLLEENPSFKALSKILNGRINQYQVKQFLKDLSFFMSPSISKETINEINKLCEDISNNPNELINIDNIRRLRELTNLRVGDDKSIFSEKSDDVKKLIRFLGDIFSRSIKENTITIDKVQEIKKDIENLNLSESSSRQLNILNEKLLSTLEEFENNINKSNTNLVESQKDSEKLYQEIEELKCSLDKAEEEKAIDYLTGVLTRRAFSNEIQRTENEYDVFEVKYAIAFFDIDHFKKINDNFGHECGDNVLFTFASILKKLTRSEDVICRYGGEEFVLIIHYKNLIEIKNYLNRVKNIITNNKFVYKTNKIEVKFSAGVSLRDNYNNFNDTLNSADKLLYKAKSSGRNKIILDNQEVL